MKAVLMIIGLLGLGCWLILHLMQGPSRVNFAEGLEHRHDRPRSIGEIKLTRPLK
jgi:hypothetical protein